MWKTLAINLDWVNFLVSSSEKYLSYDCRVYHFNHLLNVNLCNRFRIMGFFWNYIFWKENLHLFLADLFNFLINGFDKRKVKKLSHYFSFRFPSWTLWKSNWFSNHSLKLSNKNCVFSKCFLILKFIKLLSKFRINELNIRTINKVTNNNIIFWPLVFELVMTVLIIFGWIKSYWTYFCIKRNKTKIQNFPFVFL